MQRKCLRQLRMNARRQEYRDEAAPTHDEESISEPVKETEKAVEFQTGLIVKIFLDDPISDAKRFKVRFLHITFFDHYSNSYFIGDPESSKMPVWCFVRRSGGMQYGSIRSLHGFRGR